MADTTFLKTKIEDHVRCWLANKFGKPFHSEFLSLSRVEGSAAKHEFDAVSQDKQIICAVKTASWKTSGGKRGAGKIQGAYCELYFLDHIDAKERYLVLTSKEFFEGLSRDTKGKLAEGLGLLYCELPDDLAKEVGRVYDSSSSEQGGRF